MAWDYWDAPQLVALLSPPAAHQEAERVLRRIRSALGRARYREQHENQTTKQCRRELTALREALDRLSPRATNLLCHALDDRLFLPYPLNQAQAVINPCRSDIPLARLTPAVRLRALRHALDNALKDMPTLSERAPGTISPATRRAGALLCRVYGHFHHVPANSQAALAFSCQCLRTWGVMRLEPEDVAGSLRRELGQKSP